MEDLIGYSCGVCKVREWTSASCTRQRVMGLGATCRLVVPYERGRVACPVYGSVDSARGGRGRGGLGIAARWVWRWGGGRGRGGLGSERVRGAGTGLEPSLGYGRSRIPAMASSQGDVRPSPMAYPAVRPLPKLPLPPRPDTGPTS